MTTLVGAGTGAEVRARAGCQDTGDRPTIGVMRIEVVSGDITTLHVDAIVNAANSSLLGGGGVDGAIHRAAGPDLLAACRHLRSTTLPDGLSPGGAVATPGFDLPAQWVIHTVGPNRHAGQDDPEVLLSCYRTSLEVAVRIGARSVAFPAIGAGVYGWTPEESASAARRALVAGPSGPTRGSGGETDPHAAVGQTHGWPDIELVEFVAFNDPVRLAFTREFERSGVID